MEHSPKLHQPQCMEQLELLNIKEEHHNNNNNIENNQQHHSLTLSNP